MTHLKKTLLFFLFFLFISSCSIPKKIKYDDIEKEDVTISTPRNIITAVLTNRGKNSEIPNITVGKFIELADRYQACQCTKERFVRKWKKTRQGYLLYTFFNESMPLNFVCDYSKTPTQCFITEVDRGAQIKNLSERFASGHSLVRFIYKKGVRCKLDTPCSEIK